LHPGARFFAFSGDPFCFLAGAGGGQFGFGFSRRQLLSFLLGLLRLLLRLLGLLLRLLGLLLGLARAFFRFQPEALFLSRAASRLFRSPGRVLPSTLFHP
jgi:hypothetical protein